MFLATAGFTGCTSDNEPSAPEQQQPSNFDPATNSVKAQFAFSIAAGNEGATTRSGSATAQDPDGNKSDGANFRGMEGITVIPLSAPTDPMSPTFDASSAYNLGSIGSKVIGNDAATAPSSKVYNLSIPLGVDNMLFYAAATRPASFDDYEEMGHIDYTIGTETTTAFSLQPRISGNAESFDTYAGLFESMMNTLMVTSGKYNGGADGYTWPELIVANAAGGLDPVYKPLVDGFINITTTTKANGDDQTLRLGSGPAVTQMFTDLYNNKLYSVVSTSANAEAAAGSDARNAYELALAIQNAIKGYFTVSDTYPYELTLKDASMVRFPNIQVGTQTFNLPEGMAQYTCAVNATTKVPTFTYVKSDGVGATLLSSISVQNVMYPAELMYWANSPIRVTSDAVTSANYPKTIESWDNTSSTEWTNWTVGAVNANTQGVAMANNVNYGTALLSTKVGFTNEVLSHVALKDNRSALVTGAADNTFDVSNAQFQLTGIIIDNQPQQVSWNFVDEGTAAHSAFIYDNQIPDGIISTTEAAENATPTYTMVWDNYQNGTQGNVHIALEFVNNMGDFYGQDIQIREGQKFYLMAELKITDALKNAIVWPTNPYRFPYATAADARIFIQDYMTTAVFRIGKDSLKKAYGSLPSLESNMVYGVSVDLGWRQGMQFDYEL